MPRSSILDIRKMENKMSKDTLQTKEAKIIFALESLFKQKGVSKEEVTGYLEEAFNKAYSRDGI